MMRTKLLITTLALLSFFLASQQASSIRAASPTPTPSVTPTGTDTTASPSAETDPTDKLKERIDKVIEQQKDRVRGVMDNMGLKKRALFGEVQRVTEANITVKTSEGSQIFTIDAEIGLLRDNKKATIDDIAVGDWALALGYQKENDFILRRLEASSVSPRPVPPNILLGTLKSINKAKTVIDMTGRFDQASHPFMLVKNTLFQDSRATSIKKEDLKLNSSYIILSEPAASGTPSATLIRSLAE